MEEVDKDNKVMIIFPRIIEEVVTVFTYKKEYEALDNFFLFLQRKENTEHYANNHSEELRFFRINQERISFIDSSLLYHSQKLQFPILSFDKKLVALSKK